MAIKDDLYTGEVEVHFDEHQKLHYAKAVANEAGLNLSQCVAVGDSRSDLPLFDSVGLSIAFNGDVLAVGSADLAVVGSDIRIIVPLLDEWRNRNANGPNIPAS